MAAAMRRESLARVLPSATPVRDVGQARPAGWSQHRSEAEAETLLPESGSKGKTFPLKSWCGLQRGFRALPPPPVAVRPHAAWDQASADSR